MVGSLFVKGAFLFQFLPIKIWDLSKHPDSADYALLFTPLSGLQLDRNEGGY